jgi:hypothetical protein
MSTIYSWSAEMSADATGAAGDYTLVYDTSTGRTKKARLVSAVTGDSSKIIPFYGETGVDQGTFTATALTALATATFSAAATATVFGFGSSTVAKAYVKRMSQIQDDLENLMAKIDSTGLINITGGVA